MASQWMQCNFIQTTITWADAVCSLHPDTHDGYREEEVSGFDKERREERRQSRENLRSLLETAFDPSTPQAEITTELREAAAPVVERLESGRIEIDWKAVAQSIELEQRLLAFKEAFEREQKRLFEEDEDEVMILTLH